MALRTTTPGQRAAAYWFIDGLPELAFGFGYLLSGCAGLLRALTYPAGWTKVVLATASCLLLILWICHRPILEWFKARLTYRRTGGVWLGAHGAYRLIRYLRTNPETAA